MHHAPTAFVSIIGAGPGDPELLTLKAYKRLREAEVVVYDRLVSSGIIALAPRGAARIFAGKSCKQHHMTQEEINTLLVTMAKAGKRVVRLKGGDPFIFGRGGEEAQTLARHRIPFEIIPGISAAAGCSSYAGIPLTHRGLASSVRYLTGHTRNGQPLELDWQGLAAPETTLVIYMGLANLPMICRKLIEHGLAPETPAAAIQDATTKTQRCIISTLDSISHAVDENKLHSPVTVIIGRVVSLSGCLSWYETETSAAKKLQPAAAGLRREA